MLPLLPTPLPATTGAEFLAAEHAVNKAAAVAKVKTERNFIGLPFFWLLNKNTRSKRLQMGVIIPFCWGIGQVFRLPLRGGVVWWG